MKRKVFSLLVTCTFSLATQATYADSATWNPEPVSGDWNVATNWTPATIPNGPEDTATFGRSREKSPFFSAATEVNSIVFNRGASAFTINASIPGAALTISGIGIINDSGIVQNFVVSAGNPTQLNFTNSAVAGSLTVITNNAGTSDFSFERRTFFFDSSSADQTAIINEGSDFNDTVAGSTQFLDNSTAGNATVLNEAGLGSDGLGGITSFLGSSNAGNATLTNPGGGYIFFGGSQTMFYSTSSAAHANLTCGGAPEADAASGSITLTNNATADAATFMADGGATAGAEGGIINLFESATAADATFTLDGGAASESGGGSIHLYDSSTAGNATLIANGDVPGAGGGYIQFLNVSDGGAARVEVFGNGYLEISAHDAPSVTIGSLEGDGSVLLGTNNLAIGSNNLSTTFSGEISGDGSLSKVGKGRLVLTHQNTYTGATHIRRGELFLNNITNSSTTGTGNVVVDSGTLGGNGVIGGAVIVGNNSGQPAILEPQAGHGGVYLTIEKNLTFNSDATCLIAINSNKGSYGIVTANRITINAGALFAITDAGNSSLGGVHLVMINNIGSAPIAGIFSNLPDGGTIVVGQNTFQANYHGGDGNDLELTTIP